MAEVRVYKRILEDPNKRYVRQRIIYAEDDRFISQLYGRTVIEYAPTPEGPWTAA